MQLIFRIIGHISAIFGAIMAVMLPYTNIQQFIKDILWEDLLWRTVVTGAALSLFYAISFFLLAPYYSENDEENTKIEQFICYPVFFTGHFGAAVGGMFIYSIAIHIAMPFLMLGWKLISFLLNLIGILINGIFGSIKNIFGLFIS